MIVLLEILSVLLDVPSFQPTEDEIGRNIRALKNMRGSEHITTMHEVSSSLFIIATCERK